MLLEFRVRNYKLFKDEIIFKMTPANKITGMEYSILHEKIEKKEYKALPSAVIYGPNAAGKSNIIGALEVLKHIILEGNIENSSKSLSPNAALSKLELIPNIKNEKAEPVFFYIKFSTNELIFEYSLCINIGKFMDAKFDRKIVEEKLCINEKVIYHRKDALKIEDLKTIDKYLINEFSEKLAVNISESNLNDKELFLTTYFKSLYSTKITNIIQDWFKDKLIMIYRADNIQSLPIVSEKNKSKLYVNESMNSALEAFGNGSTKIAYALSEQDGELEPMSLIKVGNKPGAISANVFESLGTIRFINIFPVIKNAIEHGKTVVIDEFDASMHPTALMSIVGIFHNDEINTYNAQLIFSAHNPIFLNKNLLRRDEIKFVERDEDTGISIHYSLSDFGTSGKNGVRKSDDYMKHYFMSYYGAIRNIDFSDVFMNDASEVDVQQID